MSAFPGYIPAQNTGATNYKEKYKVRITKTTEAIKIDGDFTEATWKTADIATGFWEGVNRDEDIAKRQTEIRFAYNEQFILISILCYDTVPYIGSTLKRDTRAGESDVFAVMLDPMNQRSNAFIFGISAFNAQCEDVYSSSNNINWTWDNKWVSATRQYNDRWTGEIAIPFTTLRYPVGKKEWGINFIRGDQKNGQWSLWTKVPANIQWMDMGYFGSLVWDEPPPAPGKNISFIPYITTGILQNKEGGEPTSAKFNAGFDSKIAVSTNMNLDLTVNPDFSQIEVDQQVTNLSRFNIFFPEKRTFFLENGDLFGDLGYNTAVSTPIRPFYSRTIGLDPDGNAIPIIGGARLSGNLNNKLRTGIMNMQTLKKNDFAAQNYTAVVMKQRIWKRSEINGYFLNRQSFMSDENKLQEPLDIFGRNAGIETRFSSNSSKWVGFAGFHHSFKTGIDKKNSFVSTGAEYNVRKAVLMIHYNQAGTNYYTDMGFVNRINNYDANLDSTIRLGFKQLYSQFEYRLYPPAGIANNHIWGFENHTYWNPDGTLNDQLNRFRYAINFKNLSTIKLQLERQDNRLLFYTKFSDAQPLPPARYVYHQWNISYQSDNRKNFYYNTGIRKGGFYNGHLISVNSTLTIRKQPWGNFALTIDYNKLLFPKPYGSTELFLLTSYFEIGFSTSIFWTTFLQYNTQQNNFNINSRFQWRFKPMSDFFLVYTDNYFTDPFFKSKNRAIVLKMNYWFNL